MRFEAAASSAVCGDCVQPTIRVSIPPSFSLLRNRLIHSCGGTPHSLQARSSHKRIWLIEAERYALHFRRDVGPGCHSFVSFTQSLSKNPAASFAASRAHTELAAATRSVRRSCVHRSPNRPRNRRNCRYGSGVFRRHHTPAGGTPPSWPLFCSTASGSTPPAPIPQHRPQLHQQLPCQRDNRNLLPLLHPAAHVLHEAAWPMDCAGTPSTPPPISIPRNRLRPATRDPAHPLHRPALKLLWLQSNIRTPAPVAVAAS